MESEPAPRRSKRGHQPSAKAVASSSSFSAASASLRTSRRSQRRRVPPPASRPFTALTTVTSPVTSLASSRLAVDAAAGPNGQRRRLRAAAHTSVPQHGVPSAYPSGVHDNSKVLGRYSSRDCVLLCEVILSQLEKQTLAPTVLDETKSPAFIRWEPVAKTMETTHRLRMTPNECQLLWKFLAYGQVSVQTAALRRDSDEEEFRQSPKEVNARLAAERAKAAEKKQLAASDGTTREGRDKPEAATAETAAESREELQPNTANESEKGEQSDTADAQEKDREPPMRLYPTYSLPTGAPDAWYRPFGPKDALPLTFVASRFLRRKPTPSSAQSSDLKRKQAEPVNSAEAAKKPKLAIPPVSTRPSSTPPRAASCARSELEFFELRLREEQAQKTPGATFELSAADVQRRFGEASAEVCRQCQTLAAYDVERFNRESLRVHAREKATGAGNTKPKPMLASTASPASKPTASPSQQAASS